jgi:hypothetical protein
VTLQLCFPAEPLEQGRQSSPSPCLEELPASPPSWPSSSWLGRPQGGERPRRPDGVDLGAPLLSVGCSRRLRCRRWQVRGGTEGDLEDILAVESHRGCGGGWKVRACRKGDSFPLEHPSLLGLDWCGGRKTANKERVLRAARQGGRRRRRRRSREGGRGFAGGGGGRRKDGGEEDEAMRTQGYVRINAMVFSQKSHASSNSPQREYIKSLQVMSARTSFALREKKFWRNRRGG